MFNKEASMQVIFLSFQDVNGRQKIKIMFEHHKSVIFSSEFEDINKNDLATKLNIIDEYLQTPNPIYTRKEILKTWGKIDTQVQEYYKTLDQRGGSRQGSGRKAGSKNTTPKTDRTERFTQAITKQEKEFLTQQLKEFRERNL